MIKWEGVPKLLTGSVCTHTCALTPNKLFITFAPTLFAVFWLDFIPPRHIQSAKSAVGRLADWWCDYRQKACRRLLPTFLNSDTCVKGDIVCPLARRYRPVSQTRLTGVCRVITVVCPAAVHRPCFIYRKSHETQNRHEKYDEYWHWGASHTTFP